VWNTVYLQRTIGYLKSKNRLDEKLIKHISPLGWAHINFLGEYAFNQKNTPKTNEYRPLNISDY
jgi:hypothetical protein